MGGGAKSGFIETSMKAYLEREGRNRKLFTCYDDNAVTHGGLSQYPISPKDSPFSGYLWVSRTEPWNYALHDDATDWVLQDKEVLQRSGVMKLKKMMVAEADPERTWQSPLDPTECMVDDRISLLLSRPKRGLTTLHSVPLDILVLHNATNLRQDGPIQLVIQTYRSKVKRREHSSLYDEHGRMFKHFEEWPIRLAAVPESSVLEASGYTIQESNGQRYYAVRSVVQSLPTNGDNISIKVQVLAYGEDYKYVQEDGMPHNLALHTRSFADL